MEINKKIIFRDSLIYAFLPKISFIASILILPFITPYLTLVDYGIYGLIMAYVTVLQVVIVLGQNIILQNSFFEYKNNFYLVWRRSFGIMTIAGLLGSIIFMIVVYTTMSNSLKDNCLVVIILVGIYLILSPLDTIAVNYYVLKEKSVPFAYGAALSGIIAVICTLISIKYLKLGYVGWVISLPLVSVIKYIFYFKQIYINEKIIPKFRIKKRFILKVLRVSLPLTPHQLSLYILGASDRVLLQYFAVNTKLIGFYSQGYNLGANGSIIIDGVFQAISKKLQEAFRGKDEEHRIFVKKTMIFVPISISLFLFIVSLWMKTAFLFLFRNPELQQAYSVTIVVLSSYMFWSIYTFFTYPLSIQNKTFLISKISIIAAIFNVIGNVIFIPYFNIWATLGTTYCSYMIFGFAGLFNKENRLFLDRYIDIKKLCAALLILNVLLFFIAFIIKDVSVYGKLTISFITVGAFYLLYKKLYLTNIVN